MSEQVGRPRGGALVLRPEDRVAYRARGSVLHFKARGADTDGRFSLMEREVPPRGTPPDQAWPHGMGGLRSPSVARRRERTAHPTRGVDAAKTSRRCSIW